MAQLGWGLSPAQKRELWQRWRAGQSFDQIGRALAKHHSSFRFVVRSTGGFLPRTRSRRASALTLFEREEISRRSRQGRRTARDRDLARARALDDQPRGRGRW